MILERRVQSALVNDDVSFWRRFNGDGWKRTNRNVHIEWTKIEILWVINKEFSLDVDLDFEDCIELISDSSREKNISSIDKRSIHHVWYELFHNYCLTDIEENSKLTIESLQSKRWKGPMCILLEVVGHVDERMLCKTCNSSLQNWFHEPHHHRFDKSKVN